jgi:fumarate reductase subunit D
MGKINKALFWSLFAAGGTVTAFVFPVLAYLVLRASYPDDMPHIMGYEQLHALLSHWLAKLVAFGIVSLGFWHAAHRLRTALHGIGLRADGAVAPILYGVALVGTLLSALFLVRI